MLWQICVVLVVVYAMILRWKNREYRKIAEQLPINLKPVPILGHAVHLMGNGEERMKGFKRMGDEAVANPNSITSVWFANKLYVVVVDPEAAEVVMKACLEKDEMMNVAKALFGNGSVFAPVSIWRRRRKLVTPHFGQKTLDSFVTIFSNQASILVDQLDRVVGKSKINIFEYVAKYAMVTICESALGTKIKTLTLASHPVFSAFDEFCALAGDRLAKPWLYPDYIYRWTSNYPRFKETSSLVKDFAAKLLLEENRCTALEAQEESLVLVLAATHSSSSTFSFLALSLANNPHIQEKVFQEIKEVFGEINGSIQPDDLSKLTYLDAVIKETLMLYPPFPGINRKIDKKITLPSGLTLLPGMGVILHLWSTHRNPKYWGPDVNVFRPERFLEGSLAHPYAFMPFSHGSRNCLGYRFAMMSLKTVIAHFISRYRVLPVTPPGDVSKHENLRLAYESVLKHVDNFEVRLELRN